MEAQLRKPNLKPVNDTNITPEVKILNERAEQEA